MKQSTGAGPNSHREFPNSHFRKHKKTKKKLREIWIMHADIAATSILTIFQFQIILSAWLFHGSILHRPSIFLHIITVIILDGSVSFIYIYFLSYIFLTGVCYLHFFFSNIKFWHRRKKNFLHFFPPIWFFLLLLFGMEVGEFKYQWIIPPTEKNVVGI